MRLNRFAIVVAKEITGRECYACETRKDTETIKDIFVNASAGAIDPKILERGEVELEDLPKHVQKEVEMTLKDFRECHVWFENNEFWVMPGFAMRADYPDDEFWCNTYRK